MPHITLVVNHLSNSIVKHTCNYNAPVPYARTCIDFVRPISCVNGCFQRTCGVHKKYILCTNFCRSAKYTFLFTCPFLAFKETTSFRPLCFMLRYDVLLPLYYMTVICFGLKKVLIDKRVIYECGIPFR